jgi:hypothetical protein
MGWIVLIGKARVAPLNRGQALKKLTSFNVALAVLPLLGAGRAG